MHNRISDHQVPFLWGVEAGRGLCRYQRANTSPHTLEKRVATSAEDDE